MILTNIMSMEIKKTRRPPAKSDNVPRLCRWPQSIDQWLVKTARAKGFRSPQELVLNIIREAKEAKEASAV